MKKMTCKDMGGPCDREIYGETAEEMMMNGAKHVEEEAAMGDDGHIKVKQMMDESQTDKASGDKWFADFKDKFDRL